MHFKFDVKTLGLAAMIAVMTGMAQASERILRIGVEVALSTPGNKTPDNQLMGLTILAAAVRQT